MSKQQFFETGSGHGASRGHRLFAAVGGVLLASAVVSPARAVALGEVHVQSSLGEPLVAEVSLPAGDRGNLEVVPAPATAYSQHGLQLPERLGRITTTVVRKADGRQALRITSTGPVNDPIVDLLVQARDQSGRLDRQLTLLVSPAQLGSGAGQSGTVSSLRATKQPAGVAVQDVSASRSSRTKPRHPVHKKKARRKSKTAAAAARKPVVAVAQAKTRVLPEVVNAHTLTSAAAPKDGAVQPVTTVLDTSHNTRADVKTNPLGIAAIGAAASGAPAPAGGAAAEPVANATDAPAANPANSVGDSAANSSTDALSHVEPEPKPAMPVTSQERAPAERSAGYGLWGGLAALIALVLAGGLIRRRRQRKERLLEAVEKEDAFGIDRGPGKALATDSAAVDEPRQPEVHDAAVSPVAATHEPVQESLPDFVVTRAVPEDDPVAQADVYLSAGKVDEARAALEEGLSLDSDHIAILLKLLSIHVDQGDVGAFNESAARLAQETARSRLAWRHACEIGHRLDPSNALYAGDAPAADGLDVDADEVSHGDQSLPEDPSRELAGAEQAAGESMAEAVLPFTLESADAEVSGRIPPAASLEVARDVSADAIAQQSVTDADDTNPESGLAEGFLSERDHHAVGLEQPEPADGLPAEPAVLAPAAFPGTPLQAAAAALDGESEWQPREGSLDRPGAAVTRGFDQLPTLLQQATDRADGGDRQGALELTAEVARLLAELRTEALALASNNYG